ncbi:MAG: DUF455 family protein [Oligoflexia bacterium]|nr:DUF455 family protein [Oligoflexia bacterium]
MTPDWKPFLIVAGGPKERPAPMRDLATQEGIGDRLRTAAFAEVQAREAFNWAADQFTEATDALRRTWRALALAEQRHLDWLLRRMEELGIRPDERTVSDQLWHSLRSCKKAEEFAIYMASAEDRGRKAGERFYQALLATDPVTAKIFGKIAEEEIEHIALAARHYPDAWKAYKAAGRTTSTD